ncbi:MAG: DUF1255 family protein [Gammaproteobacteria bacterium]|nr:MAG: DUF1255 family protein [Gammaproteobacteria bacterium]
MTLKDVTVTKKAVFSHGGKVAQRSVITPEGEMKSLGLMQPGVYRFLAEAPETFEVLQGRCRIKIADDQAWTEVQAGEGFAIPAHAHFEIEVEEPLDFIRHHGKEA